MKLLSPRKIIASIYFFSIVGVVYAQKSFADVCGQSASYSESCSLDKFYTVGVSAFSELITLGFSAAVAIISIRFVMAYFAEIKGNTRSYHEALKQAWNSVSGIIIWVFLIGGFFAAALQFFGVREEYFKLIKPSSIIHVDRAYAQSQKEIIIAQNTSAKSSGQRLPNPVPEVQSLFDFIIQALRLVVRFFVYPALLVVWVWTGFSFVAAQGAPEALTRAKKYLVGAFITTIVVLCVHGFLVILHETVNKAIG